MPNGAMLWTWPNALSLSRVVLLPVAVYGLLAEHFMLVSMVFGWAVFSDLADGYLARRSGVASAFGGIIDHSSDALFASVMAATLATCGVLPIWLSPLIALAFLQYLLDSRVFAGRALRASSLGRYNGIAYIVLVGLGVLSVFVSWPYLAEVVYAAGWLLVVSTLLSMLERLVVLLRE